MQKLIFVTLALVAVVAASPKPGVFAPVIAPAVITAQSSQVVARNHNGLVSPVIAAAPLVRAAPFVAAPFAHAHLASPYVASPYVAAPYVAAPHLHY